MPSVVHITANFDDAQAKRLADNVNDRAEDLKPVFLSAEKKLNAAYVNNFVSQGSGGWKPLDPQYGAWKASHFPGTTMMVLTGKLLNSMAHFPIREINKHDAFFGTDIPYAEFHQYGTWKMPQRELFFIPELFAKEFADNIAEYVVNGKSLWN